MKKILVAFNASIYSKSLSEFAITLAQQTNSVLHAVFITPSFAPVAQYPFPDDVPLASIGLLSTTEMVKETNEIINSHIQAFKEDCVAEGVSYVLEDTGHISLQELVDHSAFTDLVLCDAKEEIDGISTRELLIDTHAPVLLVPAQMNMPSRVILCYDESFSSILAMKMYSYLFPEWKDSPSTLLTINPKGDNGSGHEEYLEDWLPLHFPGIKRQMLEGNLQKELVSFIRSEEEPAVVVMGAYGGNAMSRLFHRSLANIVLEETNAFLFVMHE